MKNDWRQKLHLEPKSGWLNDPNGLSFFNGEYHIYFQYSPESAYGSGGKCWGHWSGKDLIHLRFTGAVMRPDHPDDRSGVYSGCGFVKDGLLNLFYTGNVKEEGDHDYITSGRGANVIRVTTADGVTMSEKQTLLRNADYPDYCSCHVRDPKVWEEDGVYRMVLGARTLDDKGCVLFYRSDDLTDWSFDYELSVPDFGYMWECPDVIDVGGKRFLGISPQGMPHGETEHQNVYSSGYFRYDDTLRDFEEWDYGFDFYAPQSFIAPDGRGQGSRVLLIGWMGIGDIPYSNPTAELGWQHCLTFPRELTLREDGGICQRPVWELNGRKGSPAELKDGGMVTTELPFYFASLSPCERFTLDLGGVLKLSYGDGIFTMRFTDMEVSGGRDVRRVKLGKFTGMEMIADMSSVEVYLNGGEKVMSTRFYPRETALALTAQGTGGSVYPLAAMEVKADV
ncbi:beta-fructofuranosidase [Ruminococcus sp. YE71]|uniref:glycoside hydrolase family 32 protein n=1 Tax=unclassified Ruminococcus TaxID=2608920 RepID=UPI000881AE3A|nr:MULTISPECIES: glycoside hydrolase family 32 protein [unclassified Ruminococcus]SDA13540.1 beta-fructofuranosidase [Ruminococcus sp. YE78]SFW19259.1 beta-fructofuranosidase [Ruminococcus sp. YE71]